MTGPYRDAKLTVRTVSEESHQVTVAQAQVWLERHGTPREMALKHELKQLFPPREMPPAAGGPSARQKPPLKGKPGLPAARPRQLIHVNSFPLRRTQAPRGWVRR